MKEGCLLCGSRRWRILEAETRLVRSPEPHKVVRCERCTFTFLHPQPDPQSLAQLYGKDDFYLAYANKGFDYIGGSSQIPSYLEERLSHLETLLGKGKLLDVGAARGAFLHHARERGWQVWGVEPSEPATRLAKESLDLEVFCGTMEQAGFPTDFFDAVHMNHVLEHLPNPSETLLEIRRTLREGGILAIEVPNEFGDLFQRFRSKILRRLPNPYEVPSSHLFFFTPITLCRMVERAGFLPMELRTPRRNKDLESRIPGGRIAKKLIYRAEEVFKKGPLIELLARKVGSCT